MTDASKHAMLIASYETDKPVPSRKVCQIILEIPLQRRHEIHELLGYPNADGYTPVLVSRFSEEKAKEFIHLLNPDQCADAKEAPAKAKPAKERERVPFDEMKPSQQAGILCADQEFWRFLTQRAPDIIKSEMRAADEVRFLCDVRSRSELDTDAGARAKWDELAINFRDWQKTDARYKDTPAYEKQRATEGR